ncbi:MAG: hypothetical protein ACRCXT_19360 [Paraclostridium sp.]
MNKKQWEKKRNMIKKAIELKESSTEITFEAPKKSINLYIEGANKKVDRYDEINKNIKELEAEKKSIEKTIKDNMKHCEEVYIGNRKITYKTQTRNTIDTKALKEAYPELIEKYTKVSTYRVFKM